MSRRLLPVFFAIFAISAIGVSAWAKNDSGDTITASVKFTTTTSVGTTKLAPGQYKVVADAGMAKFEQGKKVVAEVPCTLKDFSGKVDETTYILDHNQLTEIQVSGKSKTIDFASGM